MKVAFFYSFEQSSWKSCQTITKNLKATYDLLFSKSNQQSFDYNNLTTSFEILNYIEQIIKFSPDYIVILDHKPHPIKIINCLYKAYSDKKIKKIPEIVIHIFGDFTLYSDKWLKTEKALKFFPTKFITASDSQQELIGKFLKNKKSGLYKCPFPVDSNDFHFDQKKRNSVRSKFGLTEKQSLFVYTGRMSLQKKVFELVVDFSTYLKISNDDAYLYLAGEFDDLGNPFKGIYSKEGMFYLNFKNLINKLDENAQKRIRYIGNLGSEELQMLYSAADTFISLSLHNDEDYGMSPAEAQCTGLPCILTDWGGYSSFKREKDNQCYLIKTKIEDSQVSYNRGDLQKAFFSLLQNRATNKAKRIELQTINKSYLSIESNKTVLQNILKDKKQSFSGFSPLLKRLTLAFEKHPPFSIAKTEYIYTDLYKEIYGSYISE